MKISELIEELEKFRAEHGDLEVRRGDCDFGACEIFEVEFDADPEFDCRPYPGPIALL